MIFLAARDSLLAMKAPASGAWQSRRWDFCRRRMELDVTVPDAHRFHSAAVGAKPRQPHRLSRRVEIAAASYQRNSVSDIEAPTTQSSIYLANFNQGTQTTHSISAIRTFCNAHQGPPKIWTAIQYNQSIQPGVEAAPHRFGGRIGSSGSLAALCRYDVECDDVTTT